jgi:hypothetical protein
VSNVLVGVIHYPRGDHIHRGPVSPQHPTHPQTRFKELAIAGMEMPDEFAGGRSIVVPAPSEPNPLGTIVHALGYWARQDDAQGAADILLGADFDRPIGRESRRRCELGRCVGRVRPSATVAAGHVSAPHHHGYDGVAGLVEGGPVGFVQSF